MQNDEIKNVKPQLQQHNVVGSVFIMNGLEWKVIREGIKDWYGVECQSGNRSFISMHIDELKDFVVS